MKLEDSLWTNLYDWTNVFFTYLLMMDVFPVDELPMKRILHSLVTVDTGYEACK